jgi:hypothetical protein
MWLGNNFLNSGTLIFKIIRSESFAIHRILPQNKIPELIKLLLLTIISSLFRGKNLLKKNEVKKV